MDTDANSKMDSSSSVVCDAALLLVIGEPHSDEHKSLILAEVTKGEALVFTVHWFWLQKIRRFFPIFYSNLSK